MAGQQANGLGYGPGTEKWMARGPFLGDAHVTLQVQSVLYQTSPASIERALRSLARAVEVAELSTGASLSATICYGDCSDLPVLDETTLDRLRKEFSGVIDVTYTWFGSNLGSAAGHNALAAAGGAGFILVMNPDVVVAPRTLENLFNTFTRAGVGVAEAKQMPIEHLKDYNRVTGETSWASTACALVPREVFEAVGGFDEQSFFLYCDDVDFSWAVRMEGLRVVFQPAAFVFHDKRLSHEGGWMASAAEHYYSAEAALILTHKWSRSDLTERYLRDFRGSGRAELIRAADEFESRRRQGRLVPQIDADHVVGIFTEGDGQYSPMRGSA